MAEKRYIRIGEAADMLGITPQTLRRYEENGTIVAKRSLAGQRLFDRNDVEALMGASGDEVLAFYVRESNGNKTAMENQEKILQNAYREPVKVYKDGASGLNEERKGLHALLEDAKLSKFNTLCIVAEDRLSRFGFSYLEKLFKEYNVTIKVLDREGKIKTPEEELLQDFMSLLASFSGKYYRLRSNTNQKKFLKDAEAIIDERNRTKS